MTGCIMVQGTMSNVGKSIIAAALCRIFAQDGFRVCPFKSQNMALNSFVTHDGKEMSRAQVLQAAAARVDPDVRMNPILLKPTGDMGSQVIVNGEPIGNLPAAEYFKMKRSLMPKIREAFDSLAAEFDIIVIEGAGSPAEINLRQDDIVNMGLAEMVDAPVILVGDIDPGGVFAQLYGTMELLSEDERRRVVGTVINKFRGDIELLKPGLKQIEELTKVPVLGVLPYMNLNLEDEDSLSDELNRNDTGRLLDVAVIRLPHIANYTDITPLTFHPAFGVRYVVDPEQLGVPDLIILPGTKSTINDIKWLGETGFSAKIIRACERGVAILGICGGYQILGESISDPYGAEAAAGANVDGLGLLPIETVFENEKIMCRSVATCGGEFSGVEITGYQTHNGRTVLKDNKGAHAFCEVEGEGAEGAVCGDVYGTYLHGLFDNGRLVTALADKLLIKKGKEPMGLDPKDYCDIREKELNRLADVVRENLSMDEIYGAMGISR